MTNQVKVSVIMSAYNSEKFIDSAVNSIINQTYKNLELIVMDDSSSDDTYSLLQNFEKKDNRLKFSKIKKYWTNKIFKYFVTTCKWRFNC